MTIAEMPRRTVDAGRSLGPCLLPWASFPRDLRRVSAAGEAEPRATTLAEPARREILPRAGQALPRARNSALASLAGEALAERFHAWHGASGRRYVFTIFPVNSAAPDSGLPDFAEAVVIAVARKSDGSRRRVSLCQRERGANPYARESFILEALAGGACEWHVHLLAIEVAQRRAVIADIEAMRYAPKAARRAMRA
jgi:hypothetical protein